MCGNQQRGDLERLTTALNNLESDVEHLENETSRLVNQVVMHRTAVEEQTRLLQELVRRER